jgi:hypothetical protein
MGDRGSSLNAEADDDRRDEKGGRINCQGAPRTDRGDGDPADREAGELCGLAGGTSQPNADRVVLGGEDVGDECRLAGFPWRPDQHG